MILFFEPIPRYTIWGGKACNEYFHCEDRFEDGVGQIWSLGGGFVNNPLLKGAGLKNPKQAPKSFATFVRNITIK